MSSQISAAQEVESYCPECGKVMHPGHSARFAADPQYVLVELVCASCGFELPELLEKQ